MEIKRNATLCEQIVLHFEKEIFEGRLKEGDKLPSTNELARKIGVNPETVQIGFKRLMQRGLIERTRGRGSFVRKGFNCRMIGIVFGQEIFSDPNRSFFSLYLHELCKAIEKAGWSVRQFATTEKPEYDRAFYDLESSVKNGEIQAIIEFCSNSLLKKWIYSSPIPSADSSWMDHYDFTLKGLQYLTGLGYRNIAIVTSMGQLSEEDTKKAVSEISSQNLTACGAIKILDCPPTQYDGYGTIKKLLHRAKRPEALLIGNDCICRGALFAILESGLKIPGDIALMTHSNKGIELLTHIPLTRLEVDPADFAKETIDKALSQITGKPCPRRKIRPLLIPGKSCGEK